MKLMKKTLVAAAVAAGMVGMAGQASAGVVMDLIGSGGTGAWPFGPVYTVNQLDWSPDNAITIGALSTPTGSVLDSLGISRAAGQGDDEQYLQTVVQGKLATFGTTVGTVGTQVGPSYLFGREFTFQASFYEFATGIGTATSSFRLAPGESWFRMYADTTPDASDITGLGYGDGTLILEGTLSQLSGVFTDKTRLCAGSPPLPTACGGSANAPTLLDDFGADNQSGVLTHRGEGSNNLTVDITLLHDDYFLGDIAALLLTLTYVDTTNLTTPFITANPSNEVVGVTPYYSVDGTDKINGADCDVGGTGGATETGATDPLRCDFHFQTDASGAFIPEPGSLALIGLALGTAGFATRRRRAA